MHQVAHLMLKDGTLTEFSLDTMSSKYKSKENLLHQSLKGTGGIAKAKGHAIAFKEAEWRAKDVCLGNWNLIVPTA